MVDYQNLPVVNSAALGVLMDKVGEAVSRRFVEEYQGPKRGGPGYGLILAACVGARISFLDRVLIIRRAVLDAPRGDCLLPARKTGHTQHCRTGIEALASTCNP